MPSRRVPTPSTLMSRLLPVALAAALLALMSPSLSASDAPPVTAPAAGVSAAGWTLDPAHSTVGFRIRYAGQNHIVGQFDDYSAALTLDPADPASGQVQATVRTLSVDTGVPLRDFHLREAEWFDVDAHPEMTFASTDWTPQPDGRVRVAGELTLHGTTRPVTLDAQFFGAERDANDVLRAGFQATTVIDRRDYDVGPVGRTPAGAWAVDNDVQVDLSLSFVPAQ